MNSIFIILAAMAVVLYVMNIGIRLMQFGIKYLLVFSFVGGFGFSAYQNFQLPTPQEETLEEASAGLILHRCEIQRINRFEPNKTFIVHDDKEFEVEGKWTVWSPYMAGVAQNQNYILFMTQEEIKEVLHVHPKPR